MKTFRAGLVRLADVQQYLFAHGYDYTPRKAKSVERFTKPGAPPILFETDRGVVAREDFERIKAEIVSNARSNS